MAAALGRESDVSDSRGRGYHQAEVLCPGNVPIPEVSLSGPCSCVLQLSELRSPPLSLCTLKSSMLIVMYTSSVAQGYMLITRKATLQLTSWLGTSACEASMCCIPWAGMPSACQPNSMPSRLKSLYHTLQLLKPCRSGSSCGTE
jgi:hypothetical protein